MTYTPGPWIVDIIDDESQFYLPNGPVYQVLATVKKHASTVCIVKDAKEVPGYKPDLASDARLIASAPDLLSALQSLLWAVEGISYIEEEYSSEVEQAQTAIAKATGADNA